MPIPGLNIPYEFRKMLNKFLILIGIAIIIYAVLWILAKLALIPYVFFSIFPQIILLMIGIFIFYQAWINRKQY
ncbi:MULTISPECIES: hypothetical protein [unclassified Methanobrevibacter]|jgi:uncharacterized membrane protein|uniref:hypothetical protein n=1 Tax=unclassified Methanobrevibacter TaxID=2638681 RepID=UPI0039B87910